MDLLYVSPRRAPADTPSPARRRVEGLVAAAAAAGHRVRWFLPVHPGEQVAAPDGVELQACESAVPAAHRVEARLYQTGLESRLSASVRARMPDIVHVDGYGGVSSYLSCWLPAHLGARVVAVVDPLEDLLCPRRTLRNERHEDCEAWDDPERCMACCTSVCGGGPPDGEVGRWRGRFARLTRGFGPCSVRPRLGEYANRLDMVVHGLDAAARVLVAEQRGRDALERARLPLRGVSVGFPAGPDLDGWLAIYAQSGSEAL